MVRFHVVAYMVIGATFVLELVLFYMIITGSYTSPLCLVDKLEKHTGTKTIKTTEVIKTIKNSQTK